MAHRSPLTRPLIRRGLAAWTLATGCGLSACFTLAAPPALRVAELAAPPAGA